VSSRTGPLGRGDPRLQSEGVAQHAGTPTTVPELPSVGMAVAEPTPQPRCTLSKSGDTLAGLRPASAVSRRDHPANNIANPNVLSVGQQWISPRPRLRPDLLPAACPTAEFVNGPGYVDFDSSRFLWPARGLPGQLFRERRGEVLSGAEIVRLVAHHYSVGPRLLLAMIELKAAG